MATDMKPPTNALALTADQLCKALQVSRRTFNRLRKREDFPRPVIAVHNCIRWSAADIDDWLSRQGR